ncbi:putative RNA-binding protein [Colletotrichum chlorophyti]|uniref:Putative RNA-binding protein n=1 Tax=Colletotrichum chlorophyti TaxID=708187 RepID=A0A1Q8RYJ7_9PEZI|nr:putative RNA-binding protein [Colletotrichum chlorophyti]
MAPELRKRTRSAASEKPVAKKATKVEKVEKVEPAAKKTKVEKVTKVEKIEKAEAAEKATKRKAPEQSSPVATKKQKPAKATKSKKSAPEPEVVEEAEVEVEADEEPVEEDAADSDDEVDADIQALAAGLDSDPEDAPAAKGSDYKPGQDVGKVPKFNKRQKTITDGSKEEPGVVFVSRLPHGFYEHQMRGYFSQFGPITRLRLARNKKTGASKHYAFVEFAEQSTAEIVAKTMDNYLLFGHILKVKTVPREQLHEDIWKGANRRFKKIPWSKIAAGELARPRTESAWTNKVSVEEKKRLERAEKLKELGYEFEAPKLKQAVAPPPEPMAVDAPEEPKAIEAAPVEEKTAEEAAPAAEDKEETVEEKPKTTKGKAKKGGKTRKAKA